jgi:small subunit ribosomal protein S1
MTTQMDEFERLLEESFKSKLSVADVVRGQLVKKENDGYLVDIGSKSEGFLPNREIPTSMVDDMKIGDCKEFYILKEDEDEKSGMLLSLKRVACAQAWQTLQNAKITGETVTAKVVSLVKGGVIVEVNDLRGFIPASQLRTGMPFDGLMNQEIEVKVLEADAKRNKLILSQRQALAEQREQLVDEVISNLEVDQTVEGEVVRIADFGAFIDINGVDGLLPISEISWQRIKHPSDVLTLGQKMTIHIKQIKKTKQIKKIIHKHQNKKKTMM